MLIKEAKQITGGLSHTSKMPCPSYSTPPSACRLGSLYSTYKNSVCKSCYAKKGFGAFPVVGRARENRLAQWKRQPNWIDAMVILIQKHDYFRWFDAGDIYNRQMFIEICLICKRTPNTQPWLPTLERSIVLQHQKQIPNNLTVRFSSPIIDIHSSSKKFPTSMVSTGSSTCPAIESHTSCGSCRMCWELTVPLVIYGKH